MRQSFRSRVRRTLVAGGAAAVAMATLWAATPARAAVSVGEEAPDVTAEIHLNTEPVSVAGLKGRVILLELFTTT